MRRPGRSDQGLTNGPGKLCAALGIDRGLDGADLLGDRVWLEEGEGAIAATAIAVGRRVGIDYAGEWADKPWRFWIRDNPFASHGEALPRKVKRLPGRSRRVSGSMVDRPAGSQEMA